MCFIEILRNNTSHSVEISALQVEGYDCFSKINKHHVHRGVVLYVKGCLNATNHTLNDTVSFYESG